MLVLESYDKKLNIQSNKKAKEIINFIKKIKKSLSKETAFSKGHKDENVVNLKK